jgi:hypothetical protein
VKDFVAVAISLAWGLVAAVSAYAVVRGIQFFAYPDADPAALVWSAHAGFFWRVWTASYAGGIVVFVTFVLARGDAATAARALIPAIGAAALLAGLQSALFP